MEIHSSPPPPRQASPERPRTPAVLVLAGVNLLVFMAWQSARGNPELAGFLYQHFTTNLARVQAGQPWTLFTSAISHSDSGHFLLNMFVFWSFGRIVELTWGWRRFVLFYVAAGICASAVHVSFSLIGWADVPALGASGVISGLLVVFAFLYPREKILLFFFIALPAWVGALVLVGMDLWGLAVQHGGGGLPIGHGAHLGGAAFGAVWSLIDRRRGLVPARRAPARPARRPGEPIELERQPDGSYRP